MMQDEERKKAAREDYEVSVDDMEDKMGELQKAASKKEGILFDLTFPELSYKQIDKFNQKLDVMEERTNILKWQHYYQKLDNLEVINEYEIKASMVKSKLASVLSEVKAIQPENIISEDAHDIILVFKTVENAQNFANTFSSKNMCIRCFYILFCRKKKIKENYMNEKWISVEYSPDEPTEVRWDGFGYPSCQKCFINFGLCIAGFLLSLIG